MLSYLWNCVEVYLLISFCLVVHQKFSIPDVHLSLCHLSRKVENQNIYQELLPGRTTWRDAGTLGEVQLERPDDDLSLLWRELCASLESRILLQRLSCLPDRKETLKPASVPTGKLAGRIPKPTRFILEQLTSEEACSLPNHRLPHGLGCWS